jgi:hypothetical protein
MSIKNIFKRSLVDSTGMFLLSLLFMVFTLHGRAAAQKAVKRKKAVVNEMTVIEVAAPRSGETFFTVTFMVSQRRYKLPQNANPNYLKLLRESGRKHVPVLVERAKEESDTILSVKKVHNK